MLTSWKNWCRICADENAQLNLESVDDVNAVISSLFNVSLIEIEDAPANICEECLFFVNKLEQFKERCNQTNSLFTYMLKNTHIESHPLDIKYIRNRFLSRENFNDGINDLTDDLEENAKQFLSIDSPLETQEIQEIGKVGDENTEVLYHIESLTVSSAQNELDNSINDSEQWETLEVEMDDGSNGLETDDENAEGEKDDKCSDSECDPSVNPPDGDMKRGPNNQLDDFDFPIDEDDENEPSKPQTRRIHRNTGTGRKVFMCKLCPKTFGKKSYLIRHGYIHSTEDGKPCYTCELCQKTFSKASTRRVHMQNVHGGEKPYMCEECGKPFSSKGALKEHYIIHSDERPFQCAHCTKSFKNAARLKTHEDTHNDTLYVCPHCGLKLNTKRTLNMHMVVHSDQKKFKCHECGNEYKRSKALKAHLILHTGLRPYQCPFCDKTFANGSNCRSHKKKFHPRELAALEAAGVQNPATNIPKLEHLQRSLSDGEGVEITRKNIRSSTRASTNSNKMKDKQQEHKMTVASDGGKGDASVKSEFKAEPNFL